MDKSLDTTIAAVMAVFAEAEAATAAFAARSGLGCRAGCGDCCNQSSVETTVTEMLPLARALLQGGQAEDVFEAARAATDAPCVMYRADPTDKTKGRCSAYDMRPLVCRLFGFAAVSSKVGSTQLASCKYQKTLMAAAVTKAEAMAVAGEAPRFADFTMRLGAAVPGSSSRRAPINSALAEAIARIGLADHLSHAKENVVLS